MFRTVLAVTITSLLCLLIAAIAAVTGIDDEPPKLLYIVVFALCGISVVMFVLSYIVFMIEA